MPDGPLPENRSRFGKRWISLTKEPTALTHSSSTKKDAFHVLCVGVTAQNQEVERLRAERLPMITTGTVVGCSCGSVVSSRSGMAAAWARAGTEEE